MSLLFEKLKQLSPEDRKEIISKLPPREADAILHHWENWARPEQLTPAGNWNYWLILAGRGWGKSRTGSEFVKQEIKTCENVNLIGATSDDAIRIMIEGPGGILRNCSNAERPRWIANKNCLYWPNGAKSNVFTADKPDRLRGENSGGLWCDEIAAWRYSDAWDQAQFGLRLGANPRAVVTTTPRPTAQVKELIKDPLTFITRGTTYDNKANLAPNFLAKIVKKYEGTRLGRQELNAELLDDNPGALWQRSKIDAMRVQYAPYTLKRIVVAVDPATTARKDSDETGIVVAGIDMDNHGYVLEDLSLIGTPAEWAKIACDAYHRWKADCIVAETNNGGDMIETIIRMHDANISYRSVHASRGKAIRAEPISSLYERGLIHHVGFFAYLEDQMCDFDPMNPPAKSPDRLDGMVWAFTELYESTGLVYSTL